MTEALNPSNPDIHRSPVLGRKVFEHQSPDSMGEAMNLTSNHPVFRSRPWFGSPWRFSFLDPEGTIHRCHPVYSPREQRPIILGIQQNGLGEVEGTIRIQNPTGDVLFVHSPDPYKEPSKGLADQHVKAWREHVLNFSTTNPSDGILFYITERGVTMADYRAGDIHIITAFPEWAGHTITSVTEGFPQTIPQVQTDTMTL